MKLLLLVFVICSQYLLSTDAHGRLTIPAGRGTLNGNYDYIENEPVPLDNKFICRNDPVPPANKWTHIQAGSAMTLQWDLTAAHVGDCAVYITYDFSLPDSQKKWFKIWDLFDCKAKNHQNVSVMIPSYLPSCTHCILRWEWYALHIRPTIEYFTQCVDVVIQGNAQGGLPQPQVNIPGHLPTDGNAYRDPWNPSTPQFIVGPAVATYGGSYPTSQQATSQQGTSQQGTSQATSQQATSQQQTSQQGTSQQGTSQQGTSQQATSQQETSQQGTSQQATSQQGTSQQGVSQDRTSTPTSQSPQTSTPASSQVMTSQTNAGTQQSVNCPSGVQAGRIFASPDGCNQCVCGDNGQAMCTFLECTTDSAYALTTTLLLASLMFVYFA